MLRALELGSYLAIIDIHVNKARTITNSIKIVETERRQSLIEQDSAQYDLLTHLLERYHLERDENEHLAEVVANDSEDVIVKMYCLHKFAEIEPKLLLASFAEKQNAAKLRTGSVLSGSS